MQSVSAASGYFVVHRNAYGVAPKEPFKRVRRMVVPSGILGDTVGVQTGGQQGIDLNGLLVRVRDLTTSLVKALVADGHDPTSIRLLDFYQPGQRFQCNIDCL